MTAYFNSVIVTVVVCQIAVVFSPDNESAKKYVRLLCALTILISVISPIRSIDRIADGISEAITDFLNLNSNDNAEFQDKTETDTSATERAAYILMSTVAKKFNIDSDKIRIIVLTDEGGELCEIQFYITDISYSERELIKEKLEKELEIPVYVFSER